MTPHPELRDPSASSEVGNRHGAAGSAVPDAALRLAGAWRTPLKQAEAGDLRRRLDILTRDFEALYRELGARAAAGEREEGSWLLDNDYVVQDALRAVAEGLPPAFYRRLPVIRSHKGDLEARAYALARGIVEFCQRPLEVGMAELFVAAYQRVRPLALRELWALPALLRLVLMQELARRVRPLAEEGAGEQPEADPGNGAGVVGGLIVSLRVLASHDWRGFVERVSLIEKVLLADPVDAYPHLDFATRDRYRKAVEEMAEWAERDEEEVARHAIDLCEVEVDEKRRRHVGFFLVDDGREELERTLCCRPPWRRRVRRFVLRKATTFYLASVGGLTILGTVGLAALAPPQASLPERILLLLLSIVVASGLAIGFLQWLITHWLAPRLLPKLEFEAGVPAEHRTVVVVPVISPSEDTTSYVETLMEGLEINYLGNIDPHLHFVVLSDFADAPRKDMPGDDGLLATLTSAIRELNERHLRGQGPGPFNLFHRERLWNAGEDRWMGWERKRGKLDEFNRFLLGASDTSFNVRLGDDLETLRSARYVITLDADTRMPPGTARRLVGALAHPLNRPRFDPRGDRVTAGYTVLQPRVETRPASAGRSRFSRIFSDDTGLDLYTHAVSDFYQDLFGEGIYTGKGIYDLVAFERCLAGRVPENALLSHDLFEGLHGRVAMVSDIELFEDFPSRVRAYMSRLHRWVRGDWQLLPWLAPRVLRPAGLRGPSPLRLLDLWRILDNLRRSLTLPALFVFLVGAWFGAIGGAWTTPVLLVILGAPSLFGALSRMGRTVRHGFHAALSRPFGSGRLEVQRWALTVIFLPFASYVIADAIGRTLARLTLTRKRLLEWTSAAQTTRQFDRSNSSLAVWRQMWQAPAVAVALTAALAAWRPAALPVAAPILLSWFVSPQLAHWLGQPLVTKRAVLPEADRSRLRRLARSIWLFFEEFVGPSNYWLPPDNYQQEPGDVVARRTSPTNVAVTLLSTLGAYDFGYVGVAELAARLLSSFDTLDQLERYRGHFLNWYETQHLQPLEPRYVSTVDSGNLAGCLLSLRHGLDEAARAEVPGSAQRQGLLDTLGIFADLLEQLHLERRRDPARATLSGKLAEVRDLVAARTSWTQLIEELGKARLAELEELFVERVEAESPDLKAGEIRVLRTWLERLRHQITAAEREIEDFLPWLPLFHWPPRLYGAGVIGSPFREAFLTLLQALPESVPLDALGRACREAETRLGRLDALLAEETGFEGPDLQEARAWNAEVARGLARAERNSEGLLSDLGNLSERSEMLFEGMDFGFLYDRERHLFRIGYDLSADAVDLNHYDLFASEARIASLVAIAKADVPVKHWLHLGRPVTRSAGSRVLISWGATLFEYLMPSLLIRHPPHTLMAMSCRTAVAAHIRFAGEHGIPWGISESGYYRLDRHSNYQYRTFGIPGLGLRRESGDRLVVAPYASLLALPVDPRAVLENLDRLEDLRMSGRYGLFEAVDFGLTADPPPRRPQIVRSHMSHHQGMAFLTLNNFLNGDVSIRRFHRDRRISSVQHLLFEQVPTRLATSKLWRQEAPAAKPEVQSEGLRSWRARPRGPRPQAHLLSNGRYSVLVTAAGGGRSTWNGKDLTRWREDPTVEAWGQWLYIQDLATGELWSAALEPAGGAAADCEVTFAPQMAELHRRHQDIASVLRIAVSPHNDLEARILKVVNGSAQRRRFLVMSCAEVVLGDPAGDLRHPTFERLFVESRFLAEQGLLLFSRRPREVGESPLFLAHAVVTEEPSEVVWETDRESFLGRGGDYRSPRALLRSSAGSSASRGSSLDPLMALGVEIEIAPGSEASIGFVTAAGDSRQGVLSSLASVRTLRQVDLVFDEARLASERQLRLLRIKPEMAETFQGLLAAVLAPDRALRADRETLVACDRAQASLWSQGISGDLPILLVRTRRDEGVDLVEQVLRAHAFWRLRRFAIDLVLLDEEAEGYAQPARLKLERLAEEMRSRVRDPLPGAIAIVAAAPLRPCDRTALLAAARVVLDAGKGSLSAQLGALNEPRRELPVFVPVRGSSARPEPVAELARPRDLLYDNGLGGFRAATGEYELHLEPGTLPPAPWINVISNGAFGCLVSDTGASTTWGSNSGELRLTPWPNDPVTDDSGEALYLRDEDSAEIWSPTPGPRPAPAAHQVRHGAGYTCFRHHSHGLEQEVEVFVDRDDPVKVVAVKLRNGGSRARRLTVTYYAEWVLGTTRSATAPFIVPDYDAVTGTLLARNAFSPASAQGAAFLAASQTPHGVTSDRTEFLGRDGSLKRPAALGRIGLSGTVEPGTDPCAAYQLYVRLEAGETRHLHFLLGHGESREHGLRLVERFRTRSAVEESRRRVVEFWEHLLGRLTVRTPEPAMDLLINRWLLYQTLSCRLWGRTALYQSSGAFGFRDQLQDVMALLHAAPRLARQHLIEAASRQFERGDVLHWWHPPAARGVRTRCSDDLLWLPLVTAHYVEATGDGEILEEEVPYLRAEALAAGEMERYAEYEPGGDTGTLYDHCCRAIETATTEGPHGLPIIGGCDWNDGLNRVGVAGLGESVWLGWFLCAVWRRFAPLCERRRDKSMAERFRRQATELARKIEETAWDGDWYRRAFYDDGTPLGSASSDECQIDLIAQAWAVLSGAAHAERAVQAMKSADRRLVREKERLVLLLAPPFDRSAQDPGYIKAYPPGIRENGGQYSHASIWGAWAWAELGYGDRAEELFRLLNPILRSGTPEEVATYRVEPYVIAADINSVAPHTGRGGWTWYTGAAGWLYRLGVEAILGIRRTGRSLRVHPSFPADWPGFEVTLREGRSIYHIRVERSGDSGQGAAEVVMDGSRLIELEIPLLDDGDRHEILVRLCGADSKRAQFSPAGSADDFNG